METETMVKRVIDGKAYNTDTAELLARCQESAGPNERQEQDRRIYRTRGGSYFETWLDDGMAMQLEPLSRDKAKAILSGLDEQHKGLSFKIIGNTDDLIQKETTDDDADDQQAVIFFRVSKSLKSVIETKAREDSLSVNSWLLRRVEIAMSNPGIPLAKELLLYAIENAHDFRVTKARDYPHDTRNTASAAALSGLLDYVKNLDNDHPVFDALALETSASNTKQRWDNSAEFAKSISNSLGRFGFDGKESPESFLNELAVKAAEAAISYFEDE